MNFPPSSPDVSARVYAGDFAYFIEPAPSDSEGGEGREEIIIDLLFRAKACRFPLLSVPSSAHNMLKVDVSKGGDEKCEVEEEEKGEEGEKLRKNFFFKKHQIMVNYFLDLIWEGRRLRGRGGASGGEFKIFIYDEFALN